MSTTLATLITKTQRFLDDTDGDVWGDSELTAHINAAESWLWSELCKRDDSFGMREATATLVQAQTEYNYPSDILGRNIRALYAYTTGTDTRRKVQKGSYEEVVAEGETQTAYPYHYCSMDGYFKIGPPPDDSGYTLKIVYTRKPTAMSDDADTMDSDDDFADLIAAEAALYALTRTGGDKQEIEMQHKKLFDAAFGNTGPDDLLTAYPLYRYQSDSY